MPGGKCQASRLPEGRSRKQARQKLEKDHEQGRGQRSDEQRWHCSRSAGLRGPAQALRGRRQGWQAMRNSLLATGPRAAGAVAGCGMRQGRSRSGADRAKDVRSADGSLGRRSRAAPRSVRARACRLLAPVSARRGLRRRLWRCCRAARRVCLGCPQGLRDDCRRLALDGCRADRRRRLSRCGR
jgi:hypothetical protein